MKEKMKIQKGFVQIPLLIGIIISIVVTAGVSYGVFEYHKISKIVEEAEQLTKEEKYDGAIEKLELAQNRWLTKTLGIKKQKITDEIEKNNKLLEDKSEYVQGIEEFNKENWERAKELLSKVSEISPYYQEAKNKIEEIQNKITEKQISEAVAKIVKEEQTISPISPTPISPKREETQDEEEIKTLLETWIDILNKGAEKIDNIDFKTLYETYTPNYRATVPFQEFKKGFEDFSFVCNFFEIGPPIVINVKGIVRWLYENDPQFLDIKNQMSFSQFWDTIKAEFLGSKEKITVEEWNKNFPDTPFLEDELRSFLPFCKGGRIEAKEIKIRIEKFSEGKWAKVIYKIKINNQEIPELNTTEENPDIYREINGKWYCVETDEESPGFNLADLPPDIRGVIKSKQKEKKEEVSPPASPVGYQTSEIVKNLGEYIVRVSCIDSSGNWNYGSGIIIGKSTELEGTRENTLILTNYHVIENVSSNYSAPCFVEYSSDPTNGFTDFYWATPVYFPTAFSEDEMKTIDFYFLSIEEKADENGNIIPNTPLLISEFAPQICEINDIKVGEEIVVLGYPTIGGEYLTATEGVISSFDGDYYLTTSAKIEQGNSGGGAFLKSTGCLAGMPTFAKLGDCLLYTSPSPRDS